MFSTWKTVTVAQRRESKFFLSQRPVLGSQNIQPNNCIPRMLKECCLMINHFCPIYLNIKMKRDKSPKKTTTLSIVLSMTISCLWSPGKNLTNFKIRKSLKVLKTVNPEPSPSSFTPNIKPLIISTLLKTNKHESRYKWPLPSFYYLKFWHLIFEFYFRNFIFIKQKLL